MRRDLTRTVAGKDAEIENLSAKVASTEQEVAAVVSSMVVYKKLPLEQLSLELLALKLPVLKQLSLMQLALALVELALKLVEPK